MGLPDRFEAALAAISDDGGDRGTVLLAVSGGADSVALALLWRECLRRGERAIVAHFNHGLRPEADADEAFVRDLAARLGLHFVAGRPERPLADEPGGSLEAAARRARRAFLLKAAVPEGADGVATGHHQDDQAETVLLQALRGTGVTGLAGMAPRDLLGGLKVYRPLLGFRHADLVDYLRSVGQDWREDASNADPAHRRNLVRHRLLPLAESIHPGARDALVRLAANARDLEEYLHRQAEDLFGRVVRVASPGQVEIDAAALAAVPRQLRVMVVQAAYLRQGWPQRELGRAHLLRIDALVTGESAAAIDLPQGIRAAVRRDAVEEWLATSSDRPPLVVTLTKVRVSPSGAAASA